MSKSDLPDHPAKHSVAVVIRNGDLILSIRRPDNDDELPGVWGLPAGSFQPSESLNLLIARIGRQKLGVDLKPLRKLAEGRQERRTYQLQMELWEVEMEGTPANLAYSSVQWAAPEILRPGRDRGSLCCELALEIESRRG